ncbi:MAG: hypothetical protein HY553_18820 [Elusimicrobia bacterium]|nr:hypothetical protein [Elusimicrobiota bacterium]
MRSLLLSLCVLTSCLSAAPARSECSRGAPAAAAPRPQATGLEGVKITPNPWRSDRNGGQGVRFGASVGLQWVMVFSASGKWIRTLYCRCNETEKDWDLTNERGQPVRSGFYIYLIRDIHGRQARGTLAVLR